MELFVLIFQVVSMEGLVEVFLQGNRAWVLGVVHLLALDRPDCSQVQLPFQILFLPMATFRVGFQVVWETREVSLQDSPIRVKDPREVS